MLLEVTTKLRVDSEERAKETIESYRTEAAQNGYVIKKAGYERKEKKAKGEVIAERFVVTITQTFGSLWEDLDG